MNTPRRKGTFKVLSFHRQMERSIIPVRSDRLGYFVLTPLTSSFEITAIIFTAISSLDVLSVESSQLPSANVTSTDLQYGRTSSLPKLTSLTTTKSSDSDASAIPSSVADMSSASSAAVLTVITSLVPNRGESFITVKQDIALLNSIDYSSC